MRTSCLGLVSLQGSGSKALKTSLALRFLAQVMSDVPWTLLLVELSLLECG